MTQVLQYIVDSLTFGSLYAVAALGIALIFGVAKIANFAHGELIMISSYVLLLLSGVNWVLGALSVLVAGVLLAVVMERAVFKPVRSADPTTLLVVSFAASVLLQNLVILFLTAESKPTQFGYSLLQPVNVGAVSMSRLSIVTVVVTFSLLIALALFLKKTPIGMQLRAASEDFTMARMVGVKANTVVATAFALSGFLAAVAGLLLAAQNGLLVPQLGFQPVLIAFVATIIGGMGSISGAVAGGFVVGAITGLLGVALPESLQPYRDSFVFAGVIMMLLVRPQGLIPPAAVEERV
jgi:branched-chain amino acid transport system permease protein